MTLDKHMNVVAILRSDEAGRALNAACTGMNGTEVAAHVGRLLDVQGDIDLLQGADVLILDVDPRSDEEMGHLRQVLQHEFPGTPIVVTAADASLQDVRQFMHLGVVDFVPQPITQADLKTALAHAGRTRKSTEAPDDRHGHVISFLKAGGGVGASTLAVQSACLLASRKKTDKSQVCLIDLDLQFGTDALYLDLDNRVGVADLLETPDRVDLELLHSVMGHHPSGLELLAAPRDVVAIDSLHATDLERCLKLMRAEYRTIFLDLPSAWTPWSYAAVRNSDLVILVIQLTVAGVRQARRQIEALQAHGLAEVPVKVALNRFEKGWGKSVAVKDAEKALGRKFDYFIANDYTTVNDALNQGVALSAIKKKSKVEQSLQKMIDDAIKTTTGEEARPEPRLLSGLRR
jgi:pilus assembly protein CpaE